MQSPTPDYSYPTKISGAQLDESFVRETIETPSALYPTLVQAFDAAQSSLVRGIPTKIVIKSGTYRESILDRDWMKERTADTLLIIEGEGKVVWTGSDLFPIQCWTKIGHLYRLDWNRNFGNFAYSWGPKHLIGHRVEQVFIDEQPLFQRILEKYEISGVEQNPDIVNQVSYRFTGTLKPEDVLKPGQFGVFDRTETGPSIWMNPPLGVDLQSAKIEVSARKRLLDLVGKNNLVLRNITFQHCANDDREFGSLNPVTFGFHKGHPSTNVLIDSCRFLWNSGTGLMIGGQNWTIKESVFNFNGCSGIASGLTTNLLFVDNETSFNVWRAWRGGETGYYTGGFKMHQTSQHKIQGHLALGNCTGGAWWDIHCQEVYAEEMVLIDNAFQLQFELATGPFWGHRILMSGGKYEDGLVHLWAGATKFTNSIFHSNLKNNGETVLYGFRLWDRDDPHSNMQPIELGPQEVEDCLFVAGDNVKAFAIMDDIRGESRTRHPIIKYFGKNNVFWHPTHDEFWKNWVTAYEREAKYNPTSIEEWIELGGQNEQNPRQLDPRLIDPSFYNFRIGHESKLYKERSRWPSVQISADKLKEMKWFFEWSGFEPNTWTQPVSD